MTRPSRCVIQNAQEGTASVSTISQIAQASMWPQQRHSSEDMLSYLYYSEYSSQSVGLLEFSKHFATIQTFGVLTGVEVSGWIAHEWLAHLPSVQPSHSRTTITRHHNFITPWSFLRCDVHEYACQCSSTCEAGLSQTCAIHDFARGYGDVSPLH